MNATRTPAQIEASRTNGALSHGPVTEEGRSRSSENATKHGIFSQKVIIHGESQEEFDKLADSIMSRWKPATFEEEEAVRELVILRWRIRRCFAFEARLCGSAPEHDILTGAEHQFKAMDQVSKYQARLRRMESSGEKRLTEIQEARKAIENSEALKRREQQQQAARYRQRVKQHLIAAGIMTDATERTQTVEQFLGVEKLPENLQHVSELLKAAIEKHRQPKQNKAA